MFRKSWSRRDFMLLSANTAIATFAGSKLLGARTAFAQESVNVRLGRFGSANPHSYAAATGSFTDVLNSAYSGKVTTKDFVVQSGSQVVTAIAAGSLDVCNAGSSSIVVGYANGVKMSMPYLEKVITDSEGLVVRSSEGIGAATDLKERKIGLPFNTSVHFAMLAVLDNAGMSTSDVQLLDMKPDQIVAAWDRGDIDAAYIWMPVLTNLTNAGGEVLYKTSDLRDQGTIVFDGIVFRDEFKNQRPDLVLAYLEEYARITEIYRNNPAKIIDTLTPFLSLSRETAASYVHAFHPLPPEEQAKKEWMGLPGDAETGVLQTMDQQARFLHAAGQLNEIPDSFGPLVDRSFLAKMVGA